MVESRPDHDLTTDEEPACEPGSLIVEINQWWATKSEPRSGSEGHTPAAVVVSGLARKRWQVDGNVGDHEDDGVSTATTSTRIFRK